MIGSGFGGLAAAIRLRPRPASATTIFEARDQPGGRAYVYRDAGLHVRRRPRRSITAPHCIEELFSERRPRACATTSSCCRSRRSTACSGPTATRFDYDGDCERMLAADPRRAARRRRGLPSASSRYARRRCSTPATPSWRATPFLRFWDMVQRRAASSPRLRADRSVYAHRRDASCKDEHVRAGAVVPLAARRRQPLRDLVDLHADPLPRAPVGRVLPARRHRRAGAARWCTLFDELGGELRLNAPVRAHRASRTARRHRACTTCHRGRHRAVRPGRVERRSAPHLRRRCTATSRAREAAWQASSSAWTGRCRCSSSTSAPTVTLRRATWRTTPSCSGPRYQRPARRDLPRPRAARGLQPLPARAARHRSVAGAAGRRRLLRAVAGAAPRQRAARLGRRRARATPIASWPRSSR